MTRFMDELQGSEGDPCLVSSTRTDTSLPPRRATILTIHRDKPQVVVQFEDDESTGIVNFSQIELVGDEDA